MKKTFLCLIVLIVSIGVLYAQQLNFDTVIEHSAKAVEDALPQGAKVAILNFASASETFSDHVIEELTGKLVMGKKITIVDRRNLALITNEMNLQLSGDVSDESAQAVGRMLGAQSIVSGTLTNMGTFYRFRIRVINVETVAIQTQVSLDLRNDEQVAFLLSGNSSSNVVVNSPARTTATVSTALQVASISFLEATPSYDRSSVNVEDARLAGVQYRNALVLSTYWGGYSLHNFNRRYTRFSGEIGRVDGTDPADSTVHFYGDGKLLRTLNLKSNDLPVDFSLDVTSVRQLKIEFVRNSSNSKYAIIDAVLIPSASPNPVSTTPPESSVLFLDTVPSYDKSSVDAGNVTVAGVQYQNALVLSTYWGGYSLHNLNRRYTRFSGYIGRVDGTAPANSTVQFYGDGSLLRAFNLKADDLPVDFSLDVTGVRQLKIEFVRNSSNSKYAIIDAFVIPTAR